MASQREVQRVRKLSQLMDTQFKVGGVRFGLDPILGLFPGIGDFVTSAVSFYLIHLAWQLKSPPILLFRMGINVLIDGLIDLIPFVGNFFDLFWRANERNLKLLENYISSPTRTERISYAVVVLIGLSLLATLILSVYLSFELLMAIWNALVPKT